VRSIEGFRDLEVWRRAMDVASSIYRLSERFPPHEMYGLRSQLRRAAVSISSNIAEGSARFSRREFARHVSIARGSAAEVLSQLEFARRQQYLDEAEFSALEVELDEISRMLYRLRVSLDTSHRAATVSE
jgi:four helix bundle protein